MRLNRKDMTKLFAAAAVVGAAAVATAAVVKHEKKKKAAEELKRLPKGKNIYFLGNSLAALFGAAYLMNDFGFRGDSIHIYGKYAVDGCGSGDNGFVCYDMSFIASGNSEDLFEILKDVPSRDVGDISVKTEIENYNNAYPLSATGRMFNEDKDSVSRSDRRQIAAIMRHIPEPSVTIGDMFSAGFFASDFYAMWQSMFGLERSTSAAEFGKMLREMLLISPSVENCEGVFDTQLNKYECIYVPLYEYLKGRGVEFCEDIEVTDIDFDEENKNVSAFHIMDRQTRKTFFLNKGDMCIMTPCTIYEAMTEGSFDAPAPAYGEERTPLWNRLYEKRDGAGNPEVLSEDHVILFTATFRNDTLPSRLFDITINSPGTLLTFKNSKWHMSVTCPMGQYFAGQNEDTCVITGKILNCGIEGDHVKKAAVNSSGAEILYELVGLLGLENEWEEIRESVINVIPVLLPYGGAAIAAGNSKAITDMFPAENLAMIGEFVKTDKAKGDLEFYASVAKQAVYGLFGKKPEQTSAKRPMLIGLRVGRRVK